MKCNGFGIEREIAHLLPLKHYTFLNKAKLMNILLEENILLGSKVKDWVLTWDLRKELRLLSLLPGSSSPFFEVFSVTRSDSQQRVGFFFFLSRPYEPCFH